MENNASKYTGFNRFLKSEAVQTLMNRLGDGTFREFFDDWRWIFTYSKKYRAVIAVYIVIGILGSTLGIVASVAGKYMIDIIVNRKIGELGLLAFLLIFGNVSSLLFSSAVSRLSTKIMIYVNNDIQADIFEKVIDADWLALNGYSSGDLLHRFSGDIGTVASNAVRWLPDLLINIYTFIASFAVICYYDVTMALIALFSSPFLLLSGRYIVRNMRKQKKTVLEVNSGIMSFENETFYNFDTIKSFGVTEHYNEKLKVWQKKYAEANLAYNFFTIKANVWMQILNTFVSMTAFAYCLFRLWSGSITYGTMTLFLQQRSRFSTNFNTLAKLLPGMVGSAVSAHRVREIAELPKERHAGTDEKELLKTAAQGISVQMRGVGYFYTEGRPVLAESDFRADPNEIVALVGQSGEGKTTILRLILGLLHPRDGEVTLKTADGTEMKSDADTRCLFAYVPQGNTLLSGTIAENLRLAKADASEEEIKEALKLACAWEFVSELPGGIHGTLGERGRGVSEGQAQRLAIARAVLKDAPVLLLDEATSALDADTEERVLQNIIRCRLNKTCIVSTHRTGVLKMCRRIYRVVNGTLTEENSAD